MSKKAWLILDDGKVFEGKPFGAVGEVSGEIVFSTNMTGFQESLTDPARELDGKLLLQTFPLVGNVGFNSENSMSGKNAAGLIVREYCDEPSNFRCNGTLGDFMEECGIFGIYGIDTRSLTHIIRSHGGTMGGKITDIKPNNYL